MKLEEGQKAIAMLVANQENVCVLTATENGFGKRTPIGEYTRHGRGTKGMISIQTTERNGKVVAAILVKEDDEIILLNSSGKLVRTRVSEIRVMSRNTQGVTLISMPQGVKLVGLERVTENDDGSDAAEVTKEQAEIDAKDAQIEQEEKDEP